jgi:hypothetical protein
VNVYLSFVKGASLTVGFFGGNHNESLWVIYNSVFSRNLAGEIGIEFQQRQVSIM